MIVKRLLIFLFFLSTAASLLPGQEFVTGLITNPEVKSAWIKQNLSKSGSPIDTLELPFFDDFSWSDVYPADTLWTDNYVYINNVYPVGQPTQGVATFDAIDNRGLLYENASSFIFEADHLTSCPINLEYDALEDIYLSFFYQPQGIADPPESSDSLSLQFYSPLDDSWHSVWRTGGTELQPFKPVIISIDDSRFLQKGFRFRFINYASLSSALNDPAMAGNADHWHLDYVLLDRGRTPGDTIHADVAFTSPLRSVLNTYESMPWDQFREIFLSEMGSFLTMYYANNDSIVRNVTRSYSIFDMYENTLVYSKPPVATNVAPFQSITYNASLIYTFNSSYTDSALFRIKSILITDDFDPKINDTMIYYQRFHNYFSYDDGSSEGGYGINGEGAINAMVACLFRSYIMDTIRAVSICFNDSYLSSNQKSFDIVIWSESNGIPGSLLYEQNEVTVDPGEAVNGYTSYVLDDPLPVNGYFFVGWRQRSETFLNAGLDFNTPASGKQYYFINGNWNMSQVNATLMIRPIVGPEIISTGINIPVLNKNSILIWPNPARDILRIDIDTETYTSPITAEIFDIGGRKVLETYTSGTIDLSSLPEALYLLVIKSGNKILSYNKFIRIRQ
ncbi:MAG TPA: T9SS type A sorting domain-containing protein [Bacteroidales bacterium]|nr:T9SS type A sorting domain-containing protein [Bacteroidales bacterium]